MLSQARFIWPAFLDKEKSMFGKHVDVCNQCIMGVTHARRTLMDSSCSELLRYVKYGKGDTLGLDAATEITISQILTERYDPEAILITEELNVQPDQVWATSQDPKHQPMMFFADPTDRSSPFKRLVERLSVQDPHAKLGDLLDNCDVNTIWETPNETPITITGPTSSLTCVDHGKVIFTVVLNLLTNVVVLACDIGVFQMQLHKNAKKELTVEEITGHGKPLHFVEVGADGFTQDDCRRFVTFLGKSGYKENFNDSKLFVDGAESFLHHNQPPGPPRPLYLSELQKKKGQPHVGFIMANGEKIGEWMPWLAFVKFAKNRTGGRALRAFEVAIERPWTKEGVLMSTSEAYSLFAGEYLNTGRLSGYERPSQFRCMLVVVPYDNERIINVLGQHTYREVTNSF